MKKPAPELKVTDPARAPSGSIKSWVGSVDAAHLSGAMWSNAEGDALEVLPHQPDKAKRYQRISLLGEGGMGQVWLGWDTQLERNVAIKQPKGDLHSQQARRLTYEAMITAKLEHPGIVSVHDVFVEQQRPHFVMRLISGQPLGHEVSRHHASSAQLPTALVRHLLEACEAVGYAHRMGVVHRDLSPLNVLIGDDATTHVIDWGLAVRTAELGERADYVGTPGYVAPEQRMGQGSGPPSDVWSLGALLHHILYGRPPGEEIDPSSPWPELHAIAACALEPDPAQRYADAAHMAQDLQRWFEGHRVRAYRVTPWGAARRVMRVYRKRLTAAALISVAFLVVIAVGVVRTRHQTQRALEAEALAVERAAQAKRESRLARMGAAKLIHADALAHAKQQDLVRAKQLAIQSLSNHDNPDARGLMAALAMQAPPYRQVLYTLPPCRQNQWALTSDPDISLCSNPQREAHEPLVKSWRGSSASWEWSYFGPKRQNDYICGVRQVRSVGERVLINNHLHELCDEAYTDLNLYTAQTLEQGSGYEPTVFLLSLEDTRTDVKQQQLLGVPSSHGLCSGKILNAHRDVRGRHWIICDDYGVWSLARGAGRFERVAISTKDAAHSLASTTAHDDLWVMSSQGRLFEFADTHLSWEFGETAKRMMFLPGSSLLAILGMRGKLRVFDTASQRWRVTMPDRYNDIYVDPGLGLRAIRKDGQVLKWTFSEAPLLGRYMGDAGFSMAAWSRDTDLILGVDGSGYAHMFAPFEGRQWAPVSWNNRVGKWVSASQQTNDFHFVGIQSVGVHTGTLKQGAFHVEADPRYKASVNVRKRLFLGPQDQAIYIGYGAVGFDFEVPGSPAVRRSDVSKGAIPYGGDTSSRSTYVAVVSDKNVVVWDWSDAPSVLVHEHDRAVTAVSVDDEGALLVVSKEEVVVYDARQKPTSRWKMEGSRVLDVEWVPGSQHAVMGHLDGSMTLWDTRDGTLIARGRQHTERVTKLDVSRDGRWVVTVGWDGALIVWDLEVARSELEQLLNQTP